MYNNLLYFKDIHIFSKLFAFFFCILSIFIVNNSLYYLIIIGLFYLFHQNKYLITFEIILLSLANLFNPIYIILKLVFLISLLQLYIKIINLTEIRYFIETLFYKRRLNKISYICLYLSYFFKYYSKYFNDFISLLKGYGKRISFTSLKYILKNSFTKTKDKINSLMNLYNYRFYASSSTRTYYEKNYITSLDIKYMLIFVIVFLVIYVYGR